MALLFCSNPLTSLSSSSSSSSSSFWSSSSSPSSPTFSINATPISRLHMKPIDLHPKSFKGIRIRTPFTINRRGLLIARASSDIDGTGGEPSSGSKEEAQSKEEEEVVPVENLPLESKLQERAEQKLRMKLAKKIRLRRKRLLRKRKMRKKGRWPPSKMKKLKNV